jgi:cyanophycinase
MLRVALMRFSKLLPRVGVWVGLVLALLSLGVGVGLKTEPPAVQVTIQPTAIGRQVAGGTLLIAGGGDLPPRVQQQFVELAGGPDARLVVIPGVHVDAEYEAYYFQEWMEFRPASVHVLNASSSAEANSDEFIKPLESATGVWLGGGQQTWLTSCYRGTATEAAVRKVLDRQGIVGGTSAGAAVMSEVMITGGRKQPSVGTGFGLLPGVIIDQHFIKRNRFSRLRQVVEQHPHLIGIGIDENAAVIVSLETRRARVVGDSYIMLCVPETIGSHQRVDIDFYNPGDEFQLSEPGHPETMLASALKTNDSVEE